MSKPPKCWKALLCRERLSARNLERSRGYHGRWLGPGYWVVGLESLIGSGVTVRYADFDGSVRVLRTQDL